MINGVYHNNYTPVHVDGTAANKSGYQVREKSRLKVTPSGGVASPHVENYTWMKCKSGLVYDFFIPAMIHPMAGTAIQIVPFESATGAGDWPSLSYNIQGSLDGIHWVALPTPINSQSVTQTASTVHCLVFPFTIYRVRITGGNNDGWFSVISN